MTDTQRSTSESSQFNSNVSRLSLTSDLGVIGHANSTDPVVGHGGHLPRTSGPVPDGEGRDGDRLPAGVEPP